MHNFKHDELLNSDNASMSLMEFTSFLIWDPFQLITFQKYDDYSFRNTWNLNVTRFTRARVMLLKELD